MFTSFDENRFRQAIIDKNYLRLKVNAVSALNYDPTFERGEAAEVLKILKKEIPEIFEEYKEEAYEERLSPDKWDKRYFSKLTYWFQENFAEERIPYLMEVGKAVFEPVKKPVTFEPEKEPTLPERECVTPVRERAYADEERARETGETHRNPGKAPERKAQLAGALLTAGTLVLVGFLLYKILSN